MSSRKYDIFISFKNSDADGQQTHDRQLAVQLFDELTKLDASVFLSVLSLRQMGAIEYKKAINEALDEASLLIVVGTSIENICSKWVEYEWSSFHDDIVCGRKNGQLLTYMDGVAPGDLPRELRSGYESIDARATSPQEAAAYIIRCLASMNSSRNPSDDDVVVNTNRAARRNKRFPSNTTIVVVVTAIVVAVVLATGFVARPLITEMLHPTANSEVYLSRAIDYVSAGFYQTSDELEKNHADSKSFSEAFSLINFIRTDAEDDVMVESNSCIIDSLELIEEPWIRIEPVVKGNMLYVYAANDGWGASDSIDLGLSADLNGKKVPFGNIATKVLDEDSLVYDPGDIYLIESYRIDAQVMKTFGEATNKSRWRILLSYTDSSGKAKGGCLLSYEDNDGSFKVEGLGSGGAREAHNITLFATLDVDSNPNTLEFTSADSTPLINGVCKIETVIAPTKSCKITCHNEFSVDGKIIKSEQHDLSVRVPVFSSMSIGHFDSNSLPAKLAENPDASPTEIAKIAESFKYDPNSILENNAKQTNN